ncbi:violaceus kinesin [Aspergillus lucknowensis]|uniref:Violaceus kinesin n=1 Tax=Aspergillus lucknowensis TaxID=176173 RepID=A0ABR4L6E2_9EURO
MSASSHNVVVVCLPAGVYGTISAATAVSHLRSTYCRVRFGLMVGIGGGVPRENFDIRLGDIVVSKPANSQSGVIQYDYGKTLHNGHFHRTGSLNKPPPVLLKAIAQMESESILGQKLLGKIMSDVLRKEDVRSQFPRPSKDQLFRSTYNHKSNRLDCSACDEGHLVERPERTSQEPHIYYGLIASGDQVMKDSRTRDSIAQSLEVHCFEMEAAGLMDEIPSLVIRGICDYCDSHKHKEWQGYAAFAAAAYAKALLTLIPLHEREYLKNHHYWMVPFQRNLGFVGREEEIARIEGLVEQNNGPPKIAICGLGGVGKTQIALELAYRMRARDSHWSIFWIPCTSYAAVERAYLSIAQTIGIQGVKPAEAKERVKTYLYQGGAGKWLLVFDNADEMEMWAGGPADFVPQSEQGRILFTTRNRKLAVKLASPFVIDVSEPDTEAGVKMLEKALIGKELLKNRDAAIALLEQLVFLPLAITQAAAYINSNNIQLSDYSVLLQEQESDVVELLSEDFGDNGRYKDIQNPVATTWLISFKQIQQLNPLAADYLSFMACINPRNIPQSLLPEAGSKKKRIDAIGLLKAFSFVSEQVQDCALTLHRLVYLSTRNWLRKQQQLSLRIQETADHFSRTFPDDDHTNRKIWRDYLPHALALVGERDFRDVRENYIKLIQNIGKCLRTDGRYNEAVVLFEDIMNMLRKDNTNLDPSTLTGMTDLALTYDHQGRWKEAEELQVQVMEIQKQVLGPEHPDTLITINQLASTYQNQGRWKEAEKLLVQVLETSKQVLGPEHSHTLGSMHNLALIYQNQGQWKEAEKLQVQVMETVKQVLGLEHPHTLITINQLASTYQNQGRWKEAEELQVQVMETSKQVLGPEHPHTLASMHNLASTYQDQGQWKKADELQVHVMETRKQVLGPEHPDTLTSMNNLASTYWNQGRWKEAEGLGVQVMETWKQVLGPEHPDTLTSMSNLASTYQNQGRWKEAEELGVQVMEIRKQVLGPEHPDTLTSMNNLAYIWYSQQRIHKAITLMEKCVQLRTKMLGPSHPHTTSSSRSLSDWKERVNLHSDKQAQAPVQAESDRLPEEIQVGCSPAVVITRPADEDEKRIAWHQSHGRSATPIKQFLESHPLLTASRSSSPALGAHDLQEVD